MAEIVEQGKDVTEELATLDAIRRRAAENKQQPPHKHLCEELGMTFLLQPLTGKDFEAVGRMAEEDEAKYTFAMANYASVKPKIDTLMWDALGDLPPLARAGIIKAIREISGLSDKAVEDAKNG
jgi:hypothetical protein